MLGMKMTFEVGNVVQVDWSFFDLVKPSIQSFCIIEFPYFLIFFDPDVFIFQLFPSFAGVSFIFTVSFKIYAVVGVGMDGGS